MVNPITLLLKDHNDFRASFKEIVSQWPNIPRDKTKMLLKQLDHHEQMEQQIWYPLLSQTEFGKPIQHLLREEHDAGLLVKQLEHLLQKLQKLQKLTAHHNHEFWTLFLKLWNGVLHHAHEEETRLFRPVAKNVSKTKLDAIGSVMLEYKRALE